MVGLVDYNPIACKIRRDKNKKKQESTRVTKITFNCLQRKIGSVVFLYFELKYFWENTPFHKRTNEKSLFIKSCKLCLQGVVIGIGYSSIIANS